jgi:Peptide N-acetyl-beta-D-glucosaminyl asparaginase amidase A
MWHLMFLTRVQSTVWRTSTPEPIKGDGIIWTYLKDVTRFIPLFSKPGTFILQLDNLIESKLDGEYASVSQTYLSTTQREVLRIVAIARLEATFFASSPEYPPAPRADLIVPLTTFANNTGNDASVPPGFSVSSSSPPLFLWEGERAYWLQLNVTLPQNAVAAYAELQASGFGNEEFWVSSPPLESSPGSLIVRLELWASISTFLTNFLVTFLREQHSVKARFAKSASSWMGRLLASPFLMLSYSQEAFYLLRGGVSALFCEIIPQRFSDPSRPTALWICRLTISISPLLSRFSPMASRIISLLTSPPPKVITRLTRTGLSRACYK